MCVGKKGSQAQREREREGGKGREGVPGSRGPKSSRCVHVVGE